MEGGVCPATLVCAHARGRRSDYPTPKGDAQLEVVEVVTQGWWRWLALMGGDWEDVIEETGYAVQAGQARVVSRLSESVEDVWKDAENLRAAENQRLGLKRRRAPGLDSGAEPPEQAIGLAEEGVANLMEPSRQVTQLL
ncbi:hypothetical protein CYMTET_13775 [Cymbomonas tetramitiformis]|uniref:Uncharacterized protein n=1 Tax=Cymbomonas tetramitiformis TaxID=36881 RepID=A0AAE0GHV0_9CHLO|nr:hypothetical protein CYMTET_13775 [Cymbomonas tetramitiformis]